MLVVPAVVPCCPRCQRCAAEVLVALVVLLLLVYFLLVLLLEEQRRENPHATAGTFASKIVPSPVRRAYLPKLSSQKIHHLVTNSTEQQSAHRQMARISRQAFFFSAAGRGRGQPAQTEPAAVRPPFFPGEGARANSWGQLPSINRPPTGGDLTFSWKKGHI